MDFVRLTPLKQGDKVGIVSPSYAAPGKWPHVYELALRRLREVFELEPVSFPATSRLGASGKERSSDLIAAFQRDDIRAVIASLGGSDQVTYIKDLPPGPFVGNPKAFLGFSDNTHFANFLWLRGIPSYYGASLFTQFGMQKRMDPFTVKYLKQVLFEDGAIELVPSDLFNDVGLNWDDPGNLEKTRVQEENEGWFWDGVLNPQGITWGGCLESIDELLHHRIAIPTLAQFESVILFTETSEGIPSADYVAGVYRTLGEKGILERVKGVITGRPKAWEFDRPATPIEKARYREQQRAATLETIRRYNRDIPVVQNLDFGHTDPQYPLPNGMVLHVDSGARTLTFPRGEGHGIE